MGPLRDVAARDAGRFVEWGLASQRMPGESALGDRGLVTEYESGAIVAAVDGLGHGKDAADAAEKAVHLLEQHPDESVEQLVHECHQALRGTRGAAISLAGVNARTNTLTWVGIGNVEGVIIPYDGHGEQRHIIPGPGIVGYRLPPLMSSSVQLHEGDLIVFATDGVATDFAETLRPIGSARRIAERVLATHAKGTDDALVLVVRYLGGGS